jgi:hypothetical protein
MARGCPPTRQREYERVRRLSTRKLREIIATNFANDWTTRYAEVELRRRENWWTGMRGWFAVGVSLVSLSISLATCWLKQPLPPPG